MFTERADKGEWRAGSVGSLRCLGVFIPEGGSSYQRKGLFPLVHTIDAGAVRLDTAVACVLVCVGPGLRTHPPPSDLLHGAALRPTLEHIVPREYHKVWGCATMA